MAAVIYYDWKEENKYLEKIKTDISLLLLLLAKILKSILNLNKMEIVVGAKIHIGVEQWKIMDVELLRCQ